MKRSYNLRTQYRKERVHEKEREVSPIFGGEVKNLAILLVYR